MNRTRVLKKEPARVDYGLDGRHGGIAILRYCIHVVSLLPCPPKQTVLQRVAATVALLAVIRCGQFIAD